jgi:hypothetical protein
LTSTLVRAGAFMEAARRLPGLLSQWQVTATWPQAWTTLRLSAIVLAGCGRIDDAAVVLAAAEADPAAPEVPDTDAEPIADVWRTLADRNGAAGVAVARTRATVLRRHEVLELAIHALEDVASG